MACFVLDYRCAPGLLGRGDDWVGETLPGFAGTGQRRGPTRQSGGNRGTYSAVRCLKLRFLFAGTHGGGLRGGNGGCLERGTSRNVILKSARSSASSYRL